MERLFLRQVRAVRAGLYRFQSLVESACRRIHRAAAAEPAPALHEESDRHPARRDAAVSRLLAAAIRARAGTNQFSERLHTRLLVGAGPAVHQLAAVAWPGGVRLCVCARTSQAATQHVRVHRDPGHSGAARVAAAVRACDGQRSSRRCSAGSTIRCRSSIRETCAPMRSTVC